MPNWVRTRVWVDGDESELMRFADFVKGQSKDGEENVFDFNKIIPMPDELDIVSGGYANEFMRYYILSLPKSEQTEVINKLSRISCFLYGDYAKKVSSPYIRDYNAPEVKKYMEESAKRDYPNVADKTLFGIGKQYVDNIIKYGSMDWYGWASENWGTKWNSCEASCNVCEYANGRKYLEYQFDTAWGLAEPIFKELASLFPMLTIEGDFADEDLGNNCGEFYFGKDTSNSVDYYEDAPNFACEVWGYDPDEVFCTEENYEEEEE